MELKIIPIPAKGRNVNFKNSSLTSSIYVSGSSSSSESSSGGGTGTSWLESYFTDGASFLTLNKEIRMTGGYPIPTRVASIADEQLLYWKDGRIAGSGIGVGALLQRTVNEQISGSWYFTTRVQSRIFDVMRQTGGGTDPIALLQGRTEGGFIAGRRGVHFHSIDDAGYRHLAFLNWEESFISGKLAIGGSQRVTPSPHTVHIAGSLGLTGGIAIGIGNLTIAGGNIILSDGSLQVSHSLNAGTDVNIARDLFVTRNVEVTGTTELKSRLTLSKDALHEHLHIKRGSAEASITLSSNAVNVASLILRADISIANDIAISPAGNLTAAGNLYASGGTVGIGTGTSDLTQFFYSSSVFRNTFGTAVSYWDVYFGTTLHSRFIKGTGIQIRDGGLEIGYSGVPHYRQRIGGTSPNYYLDFTLVNNLTGFRWYFGANKRLELFANGDLGIFRNAVVGAALTVETTSLLKGAITGQSTMDITGLSRFDSDVSSKDTVFSGFGGSGWRIQKIAGSPNRYHFTIDRLTVRQTMDVYELVINQMRGTNGSLLVSDTAKISAITIVSSSIWDVTVDTGGETTLIPFVNGDKLMCSKWTASGLKYYEATVSNINTANGTMRLTRTSGTSTAAVNDVVGRIDSSNSARRGYIYITSSDNNAPYLDVVHQRITKVRLGNLAGIVDSVLGSLSGFGLYSDNVFLRGRFVVAGGGTAPNEVSTRGYVDAVQVGGRNHIPNSSLKGTAHNVSGNLTRVNDPDGLMLTRSNTTASSRYFCSSHFVSNFALGDQITLSAWIRLESGTVPSNTSMFVRFFDSNGANVQDVISIGISHISGDWVRVTGTGTITNSTIDFSRNIQVAIGIGTPTAPVTIQTREWKLELGNRATDWTPAPEDVDAGIAAAETSAKNFATSAVNTAISTAANDATAKANAAYNNALAGSQYYTDNQLSTFESSLGDLAFSNLIGKAQLDTTVISGGFLANSLINTVWLQAQIITTTYIEGMTLNFQQGTIGGWKIDGNLLYTGVLASGSEYHSNSHGIFLRSTVDGRSIVVKGVNTNSAVSLWTSPTGSTWGLQGVENGNTIFQLGSTNRIAGWEFSYSTFASQVKIPNTTTPVMEINSSLRHFQIRVSTMEYIKMFYTNSTNWGIEHKYQATSLFQLGSTNQIAGWHFGADYMGMNSGGSRFIVMSNNHIGSATVDGGASYLRAGFGIYNYDSVLDPLVPAIKLIRVGVLTNPDTSQTFPSTPIYGIQIGVRKPGVGYRDIFRADSLGNSKIAGVNFDNESMWTTNWRLNADGTANFGQWTVFDNYFYAGKNHVSGPDFAGVYLMARPAPAEYYAISVGRNRTSHYISMYYNATNNAWGFLGYCDAYLVFQLGNTNKIAGWTFDHFTMWAGSEWSTSVSTGGVSIGTRPDDRHFRAFLNSQNYVDMTYVSSSNWGLKGVSAGNTIFQLGAVNKIAGFTFTASGLSGPGLYLTPSALYLRAGGPEVTYFTSEVVDPFTSYTRWRQHGGASTSGNYIAYIEIQKKQLTSTLQYRSELIFVGYQINIRPSGRLIIPGLKTSVSSSDPSGTVYRDGSTLRIKA